MFIHHLWAFSRPFGAYSTSLFGPYYFWKDQERSGWDTGAVLRGGNVMCQNLWGISLEQGPPVLRSLQHLQDICLGALLLPGWTPTPTSSPINFAFLAEFCSGHISGTAEPLSLIHGSFDTPRRGLSDDTQVYGAACRRWLSRSKIAIVAPIPPNLSTNSRDHATTPSSWWIRPHSPSVYP